MLRTLIVATTSYAGMGPYVSEIVNNFSVDDDVFFFFHDYEDAFFKKNVRKELHQKSMFHQSPNSAKNKLMELLRNRFSFHEDILRCCEKWSVKVVHFINGCPGVNLQQDLQKRGVKVLGTVHDLHPHEAKKQFYKMIRFKINAARNRDAIRNCSSLVTNALDQYEELKKMFPKKKVSFHAFPSLVSKGIKEGNACPPEIERLQKPYILFFGRIETYKGVDLLCEAYEHSGNLREQYNLVVAGKGLCPYEQSLRENGIIWVNRYIKDEEVAELYKRAKCVVYPYISATQSGVLSLAYYFQVPVLASDIPFFKSAINDNCTGRLFKCNDVDDLSLRLSELLQADNDEMRMQQLRCYKRDFDGESIRQSLLKIYSEQAAI